MLKYKIITLAFLAIFSNACIIYAMDDNLSSNLGEELFKVQQEKDSERSAEYISQRFRKYITKKCFELTKVLKDYYPQIIEMGLHNEFYKDNGDTRNVLPSLLNNVSNSCLSHLIHEAAEYLNFITKLINEPSLKKEVIIYFTSILNGYLTIGVGKYYSEIEEVTLSGEITLIGILETIKLEVINRLQKELTKEITLWRSVSNSLGEEFSENAKLYCIRLHLECIRDTVNALHALNGLNGFNCNKNSDTLLHKAAQNGDLDLFQILATLYPDLMFKVNNDGQQPLVSAVGRNPNFLEKIIEAYNIKFSPKAKN